MTRFQLYLRAYRIYFNNCVMLYPDYCPLNLHQYISFIEEHLGLNTINKFFNVLGYDIYKV